MTNGSVDGGETVAQGALSAEYVSAVWDVLVAECGAREEERQDFLYHWPGCTEYRFIGRLGFGGKVWSNHGEVYVSYYPEDETNARNEMVQRANAKLSALHIDGDVCS